MDFVDEEHGRTLTGSGAALDRREDLGDGLIRERADLVVGAVLDRVRNEHRGAIRPERAGLGLGGVDELGRRDEDAGDAGSLEVHDVVHTARRA